MLAAGQAVAQPRGDQADDGRLQGHGVVVAGEPVQVYPLLGHLAPAQAGVGGGGHAAGRVPADEEGDPARDI